MQWLRFESTSFILWHESCSPPSRCVVFKTIISLQSWNLKCYQKCAVISKSQDRHRISPWTNPGTHILQLQVSRKCLKISLSFHGVIDRGLDCGSVGHGFKSHKEFAFLFQISFCVFFSFSNGFLCLLSSFNIHDYNTYTREKSFISQSSTRGEAIISQWLGSG